jgi:type II secretory pathway component PulF
MAYAVALRAVTPGVPAQTLAIVFRELAMLLRAGINVNQALQQAGTYGPRHFQSALMHLSHQVAGGEPLSEGMREYGGLFHPVVPAIVEAGERTGALDQSFSLLAEFFESEAELVRTLRSAMIYPSLVVFTAIAAVGILSWIGFMPGTWAVRLLWGVGVLAALWLLMRLRTVQVAARYLAMALPFFGGIIQQLAIARFCHTFGLLCRAGVPYLEGLESTRPTVQHPAVERAVDWIYSGVRNGNQLEDCIRHQPVFPAIVRNLVGAGEASGTVDETLLKAGQFLRQDAEYKIKNSAKFAGPVMILVLGVIVGFILVGFWGAYWDKIMGVLEE